MPWWTFLNWILRAVILAVVVIFAYLGVLGLYTSYYSSADGRELSAVVAVVFLFIAAMLVWWWCLE